MDIRLIRSNESVESSQLDVLLLFEDIKVDFNCEILNSIAKDFKSTTSNIEAIKLFKDNKFESLLLVGMGKKSDLDIEKIKNTSANVVKKAKQMDVENISFKNINDEILDNNEVESFIEGLILGNYKFDKYKTDKKSSKLNVINIITDRALNTEIENGKLLAEATIIARELVNEPANVIYPETLANKVKELGKEYGFETEIYDKKQIEDLKME
ncbi:MAG: M17 family peptidase N-terminal domain-containing protein, partial [Paraclostridium sp.]